MSARAPDSTVESLAGRFHPHAIEVQDFSYYALILDVRSASDFEDDHIPGAVRFAPESVLAVDDSLVPKSVLLAQEPEPPVDLPAALAALVAPVRLDQAILVYCGRGGRDSQPVARALRWRGWTVDVLPGGWINYRRWVQAGLEMLPRLIAFRVVSAALTSEAARCLAALSQAGQQVLDLEALAPWRSGALTPSRPTQPPQAQFESGLLAALRQLDPLRPVWVADLDRSLGSVALPGALRDALSAAPMTPLVCPRQERLARWREDEVVLGGTGAEILQAVAHSPEAFEPGLLGGARASVGSADAVNLLDGLLQEVDRRWLVRSAASGRRRPQLAPLVTDSLEPERLLATVRAWLARSLTNGPP